VLLLLAEEPRHGYQLIQDIGERSNGAWNPSPGSVYPVLQQLEDEGLIVIENVAGRKTASLTDEGRTYVEEHADELGTPWDDAQADFDPKHLRDVGTTIKGLFIALRQVLETGTPAQRTEALKIVNDARRRLYALLAEDETA
jgi:DNA-binding PadR family transcriptional regulator